LSEALLSTLLTKNQMFLRKNFPAKGKLILIFINILTNGRGDPTQLINWSGLDFSLSYQSTV